MKSTPVLRLSFAFLLGPLSMAQSLPTRPQAVTELIAQLPECSNLRQELEKGRYGDGIEQPYMQLMLDHGVRRAYFAFQGKWSHGHVKDIRIVQRLYFSQFDGPNTAITDAGRLKEIDGSGLQAVLDQVVLARAANAVQFRFMELQNLFLLWPLMLIQSLGWHITGSTVNGSVELFASGWPRSWQLWWPRETVDRGRARLGLGHAAYVGDVIGLSKLLREKKYPQIELSIALNRAVMSRWDNTATIDMLIKAGADVNAKFGDDGTTLLMLTYQCACDIPILLADGARLDDRDKSGRTAYDIARQRHDARAMRLLQNPEH